MNEPHNSSLMYAIDRILRVIPFDVWVAAAFASVVLIAIVFDPSSEVISTILFFGGVAAAYEYLNRNQSKDDQ